MRSLRCLVAIAGAAACSSVETGIPGGSGGGGVGVDGRVATVAHGGIIPLPSGFLEWSFTQFRSIYEEQFIDAIDDSGKPGGAGRNLFYMYAPREELLATDVNGGAALAGTSHVEGRKDQRRV